jgi:hypothetical protein
MTIREAISRAFDAYDPKAAGLVSDALRAKGLTYAETFSFVQKVRPSATLSEWDELLQEGDEGA